MFCTNCGKELHDQAVVCPFCGVPTENYNKTGLNTKTQTTISSGSIKTVIKVFMIIGCIVNAFAFLIPLAWCLPMTLCYIKATEKGETVSTGFKVCALLFVSVIAGILMFFEE